MKTRPLARRFAVLACSLAAGLTWTVMAPTTAQAATHSAWSEGRTASQCASNLAQTKAHFTSLGRNITDVKSCRYVQPNLYRGFIYWTTRSAR